MRETVRRMGRTGVLGGILVFALLFNSIQAFSATAPAGQSVSLSWDASPSGDVTGFNVYYGAVSGAYTNMVNAGSVMSTTISGLVAGVTYYFAATAYDGLGMESDFSSEVSYLVPANLSVIQIRLASAGQFVVTVTGLVGRTYEIQATQDFWTWTVIGTVTVGVGGSLDFTDPNAAAFPQRFYRTRETP